MTPHSCRHAETIPAGLAGGWAGPECEIELEPGHRGCGRQPVQRRERRPLWEAQAAQGSREIEPQKDQWDVMCVNGTQRWKGVRRGPLEGRGLQDQGDPPGDGERPGVARGGGNGSG